MEQLFYLRAGSNCDLDGVCFRVSTFTDRRERIIHFLIDQPVRKVVFICEHSQSAALKEFKDRRRTACAHSDAVFALTDDVAAVFDCAVDKLCGFGCLREIERHVLLTSEVVIVDVLKRYVQDFCAAPGIVGLTAEAFAVKADNGSFLAEKCIPFLFLDILS